MCSRRWAREVLARALGVAPAISPGGCRLLNEGLCRLYNRKLRGWGFTCSPSASVLLLKNAVGDGYPRVGVLGECSASCHELGDSICVTLRVPGKGKGEKEGLFAVEIRLPLP